MALLGCPSTNAMFPAHRSPCCSEGFTSSKPSNMEGIVGFRTSHSLMASPSP